MADKTISFKSAIEVAGELALRVRAKRLSRKWTQQEIAERAGLQLPTYILFERTGKISLIRLLKVLDVLGLLDEFDQIGRGQDLTGLTMKEISQPARQRGYGKRRRSSGGAGGAGGRANE